MFAFSRISLSATFRAKVDEIQANHFKDRKDRSGCKEEQLNFIYSGDFWSAISMEVKVYGHVGNYMLDNRRWTAHLRYRVILGRLANPRTNTKINSKQVISHGIIKSFAFIIDHRFPPLQMYRCQLQSKLNHPLLPIHSK